MDYQVTLDVTTALLTICAFAEVFNCYICFTHVTRGHGVSKPWQAGEVLRLLPTFPHLLQIREEDF